MRTPINLGLFQSDLDASGYKLIGLPTPAASDEAATKAYVDAHAGGGGSGSSFVTNVKDYGALGDGVTNDTAAIQSAINAVHTAGGGVVFFPNGVYIIGGALQTSVSGSNPNSQLYVPLTTDVSTAPVIKLLGETPPSMLGTALLSWPKPLTGVVLKSTISGSGSSPAIIGSTYVPLGGWGNFNNVQLALENLTFMVETYNGTTHSAPSMNGINAGNLQLFSARNVRVTTESPNWDSADPGSANVAGIITPNANNDGWTYLEGILVEAFTNGIVVNEHTQGEQINIFACTNALNFLGANHSSNFDQLLIHWCKHNVTISGSHYFTIYNTAIEDIPSSVATKWYNNVTDLNDSGNNGHGNYWFTRVVSSFGVDNAGFVKTGGSGVLCNPIGGLTVYIGTDARLVPITGGAKLQARNPGTNTWADKDQWTNP